MFTGGPADRVGVASVTCQRFTLYTRCVVYARRSPSGEMVGIVASWPASSFSGSPPAVATRHRSPFSPKTRLRLSAVQVMPRKPPSFKCATRRPEPPDAGVTKSSVTPKVIVHATASDEPSGEKTGTRESTHASDGLTNHSLLDVTTSTTEMPH